MIFGKAINRYYLKHAPVLLLGILSLLTVDYIQLLIPELYRLVINGVNLGQVVVDGQTLPFTREVLFQHICLPMIWIVVLMVIGRFLWRVCFFGSAVSVAADLRERMFDHSRRLSQQYYQVNKVGNLMSLYTNDLDTIQECFGDGILMFFDAAVLGIMALVKMWRMDCKLTLLALIPAAVMFVLGTVMSQVMTRRWEERQQAFSDLSDFAQENFSGIAVIKAFVKELKELIAFRRLNKENEEVNVAYTKIATLLEVLVTLFVESVICVILGYGGWLVWRGQFNAGQLVDRLGVAMGLRFPAGKELEKIAAEALKNKSYADSGFVLPSSVKSLSCSFSGVETKAANALKNGEKHGTVAAAVYDCIARTLAKLVKNAIEFETENAAREVSVDSKCSMGDETASTKSFLFAGGVASSTILREMLADRLHKTPVELHFSRPVLSSDNAVGIAALAAEEDAFNGRTATPGGT